MCDDNIFTMTGIWSETNNIFPAMLALTNACSLVIGIKIPGFIAAQRFILSDEQMQAETPYRYMAIYEIETDDLKTTLAALGQAVENGMVISSAIDMENIGNWIFTPITSRVLPEST